MCALSNDASRSIETFLASQVAKRVSLAPYRVKWIKHAPRRSASHSPYPTRPRPSTPRPRPLRTTPLPPSLAHASPSPPPPSSPLPPKVRAPPSRHVKPYILISSIFALTISAYVSNLYTSLSRNSPLYPVPDDADPSGVYDATASEQDGAVESIEDWTGIMKARRRLIGEEAWGRVLENCAGTGRNGPFYDFAWRTVKDKGKTRQIQTGGKVTSIDFVDQSSKMIEIARKKWETMFPESSSMINSPASLPSVPDTGTTCVADSNAMLPVAPSPASPTRQVRFITSATLALPLPSTHVDGKRDEGRTYDTIVQTFGLCSMPHPLEQLRHLLLLLSPSTSSATSRSPTSPSPSPPPSTRVPKIILLEHGRSSPPSFPPASLVNWTLDRSAADHAKKWGCYWNRDIPQLIAQAEERGWMVVERCEKVGWTNGGTVWRVVGRRGPNLERELELASEREGVKTQQDQQRDMSGNDQEDAGQKSWKSWLSGR